MPKLRSILSFFISTFVTVGALTRDAMADDALAAAAAESARDQRVTEGTEALAFGVTFAGAGVASWVTPSSPGSSRYP